MPGQGDQQRPIDEAFQLGNGGWTVLVRAQGTALITGPIFAYPSGYYGMSLTEHTEVLQAGALRGVPDTYSGRLGLAYLLPVLEGVALSFGGQINGVTVKDIVGGITVPVRVYQNKLDSLLDVSLNRHIGAGFVPFLFQATYARRF